MLRIFSLRWDVARLAAAVWTSEDLLRNIRAISSDYGAAVSVHPEISIGWDEWEGQHIQSEKQQAPPSRSSPRPDLLYYTVPD